MCLAYENTAENEGKKISMLILINSSIHDEFLSNALSWTRFSFFFFLSFVDTVDWILINDFVVITMLHHSIHFNFSYFRSNERWGWWEFLLSLHYLADERAFLSPGSALLVFIYSSLENSSMLRLSTSSSIDSSWKNKNERNKQFSSWAGKSLLTYSDTFDVWVRQTQTGTTYLKLQK